MKFVDSIEISIKAGDGGPGMVSFRSAKNKPKLGADGGDGGFGGDVLFVGSANLNTLSHIYYKQLYKAQDGGKGGPNGRTGADGEALTIPVPLGTVLTDRTNGRKVCEVMEDGEHYLVAKGGKRGLGNMRYLSATHQAPEEHTRGGKGEAFTLQLDLKVIADAGFAGFPNAGKSTLLSVISRAKPKIADYPFTTLVPHLGVVTLDEDETRSQSYVVADIPGLIEGASEGKGLGHEFLKHLERTKVIVFVLDGFSVEGITAAAAFAMLREELKRYSAVLAKKRAMVVVTKADLAEYNELWAKQLAELRTIGLEPVVLSAVTGEGVAVFKRKLFELINSQKLAEAKDAEQSLATAEEKEEKTGCKATNTYEGFTLYHRADADLGLGQHD